MAAGALACSPQRSVSCLAAASALLALPACTFDVRTATCMHGEPVLSCTLAQRRLQPTLQISYTVTSSRLMSYSAISLCGKPCARAWSMHSVDVISITAWGCGRRARRMYAVSTETLMQQNLLRPIRLLLCRTCFNMRRCGRALGSVGHGLGYSRSTSDTCGSGSGGLGSSPAPSSHIEESRRRRESQWPTA